MLTPKRLLNAFQKLSSVGCRAVQQPRPIGKHNQWFEEKKTITISGTAGESGQINSRNHTSSSDVTYTLIWLLAAPLNHVIQIEINPDAIFVDCDDDLLEIYDMDKRVRGYTSKRSCPRNYSQEEQQFSYQSQEESLVIIYRRNRTETKYRKNEFKNDGFQLRYSIQKSQIKSILRVRQVLCNEPGASSHHAPRLILRRSNGDQSVHRLRAPSQDYFEDIFEVSSLLNCTAIELYWRGRDTVCYKQLDVFVDNGIEPLSLISKPTWISYDCPNCVHLKMPLIRDTINASSRLLQKSPKKPLCSIPIQVHISKSVEIGGWKRCLTIVQSHLNMLIHAEPELCDSNAFRFYKCATKIDKGNEMLIKSTIQLYFSLLPRDINMRN